MAAAPPRHNEAESLAALRALDVLDTAPEPAFDAIVRAASIICGTPISLISLIDSNRQWFKANFGLPGVTETSRDLAFCAHAVLEEELFEVGDATHDGRFAENPLVTEDPSIRFYAGIPLTLRDGNRIGTLCVIDRVPRELTDQQREVLRCLGEAAAHALEGRRAMNALKDAAMETARSEAMLSVERRRLSNIIDGANVGTWDINVRTGEVKVSARWAEMSGESLDTMKPLTVAAWFDQFHPHDVERVRTSFDRHVAGDTSRFECEARTRAHDGSWRWVIDRGRIMTRRMDGGIEWVVGARIDIESHKQKEDVLRRSQDFLDRTGKLAGVGGWQIDLASKQIFWSDQTRRIYGVPADYEPVLEQAIDFYAPEARPIIQAAVEKCMETGEGWDLELPFIRADGEHIWVRAVGSAELGDGGPVRLVGAFQDVTDSVREHLALKAANERVALATDSGGIGIWEYDLGDRSTIWDAWMYRIYGLPPGERLITFKSWQSQLPKKSLDTIGQAVAEAVAGTGEFDIEFDIFWTDGSVRHVRSTARVVRDAEGRGIRLIGSTWDVTEARVLAAELRRQSVIAAVQAGVAVAANQSKSLTAALRSTIDLICSHTGWDVGHVYLCDPEDPEVLIPSAVWNTYATDGFDAFKAETATTTFTIGVGLVGRVLRDRRTVVIDDLSSHGFVRHESAAASGLRHGLAAPVLSGDEVVAILEFFARDEKPMEQSFIELVSYAGMQIGRVVDRERARVALEHKTKVLREQSIVDELSGLYNRRGFLELAEERRRAAIRTGQRVFLLFADLDGMKRINDELGHASGDLALVETADVLRRTLRTADIIARLGGDEFVALTCETGTFDIPSLLARLDEEVSQVNATGRLSFQLAVSFGITGPAGADEDVPALLKRADSAMYERKAARKRARS